MGRVPVATLCLAFLFAPDAVAQATPEQKAYAEKQRLGREAAERKRDESAQRQRENQELQRKQKDAQQDESQRNTLERQRLQAERERVQTERERTQAERERSERRELERAEERRRQDADWRRSAERDNPRTQPPPVTKPGPHYVPPNASGTTATQRQSTATSVACAARPICTPRGNSHNVCKGVQQTYKATGATQVGIQDIVQRCRAANAPDPCGSDARGTPGTADYRFGFTGGCAEQCAQVAYCTPTDRR